MKYSTKILVLMAQRSDASLGKRCIEGKVHAKL